MAHLTNDGEVVKKLDAMTSLQRSAFPLLLADHVLAFVEPLDRERASRMSPAIAMDYLYLPRIEPFLARWWRELLGLPPAPASERPSLSVSDMVPEGSLAHRFAELHMAATEMDLTRLAMTVREPFVASVILVVELAGDLASSSDRGGRHIVWGIDYALIELYERVSTMETLDASLATCLALAAEFDGTPDGALAACSRARASGPTAVMRVR